MTAVEVETLILHVSTDTVMLSPNRIWLERKARSAIPISKHA